MREHLDVIFSRADCAGPVPERAIVEAEDRLQVAFPPSYRQFLSAFGAALGAVEIAGLVHPPLPNDTPPTWSDVIKETIALREKASIPNRFLPISHDGMDCTYCLDVSHEGEAPVVALSPGRDFEFVAPSFLAFVELSSNRGYP